MAQFSRRAFIKGSTLCVTALGGLRLGLHTRPAHADWLQGNFLVYVYLRGGIDGLNMVCPIDGPDRAPYEMHRPNIHLRTAGATAALPLGTSNFGLNFAATGLHELYGQGKLAIVHGTGFPIDQITRSHFDAQDYMETGTPDRKGTTDGWLNRYLAVQGTCQACTPGEGRVPFRAVSMTAQTPRILEGTSPVVAMNSIDEFSIRTNGGDAERRLEALYRTGSADLVHGSGSDMFEALRVLRAANPRQYAPANGAQYPRSAFGQRLLQIAQLIKAGVGLEVAFADVGGWDTHVNQGGAQGQLANRLADFSNSIAALVTDLGDRMDDVVILTCSEFGRTVRQNGTGGTDHGHAGAMFVIGGSLAKSRTVRGRWPGLAPEQLYEGRDLALTTDFRAVFAEVASHHLGARDHATMFPGYAGTSREWLGVLTG